MPEYKDIEGFIGQVKGFLDHDRLHDFIPVEYDEGTGEIILDTYVNSLSSHYHDEPAPFYEDWTDEEEEAIYAWIKRAEEAILKEVDTDIVKTALHKRFIEIAREICQVATSLCEDLIMKDLSSSFHGHFVGFSLVMGNRTCEISIRSKSAPRYNSSELYFVESDTEADIRKSVREVMENAKE